MRHGGWQTHGETAQRGRKGGEGNAVGRVMLHPKCSALQFPHSRAFGLSDYALTKIPSCYHVSRPPPLLVPPSSLIICCVPVPLTHSLMPSFIPPAEPTRTHTHSSCTSSPFIMPADTSDPTVISVSSGADFSTSGTCERNAKAGQLNRIARGAKVGEHASQHDGRMQDWSSVGVRQSAHSCRRMT